MYQHRPGFAPLCRADCSSPDRLVLPPRVIVLPHCSSPARVCCGSGHRVPEHVTCPDPRPTRRRAASSQHTRATGSRVAVEPTRSRPAHAACATRHTCAMHATDQSLHSFAHRVRVFLRASHSLRFLFAPFFMSKPSGGHRTACQWPHRVRANSVPGRVEPLHSPDPTPPSSEFNSVPGRVRAPPVLGLGIFSL